MAVSRSDLRSDSEKAHKKLSEAEAEQLLGLFFLFSATGSIFDESSSSNSHCKLKSTEVLRMHTKQDFSSFKFITGRYLLLHWRIVGDLQSDVQIQLNAACPKNFKWKSSETVSVCSARALGCNASVVLFFEFHQTGPIKALPTKQRKTNLSKM